MRMELTFTKRHNQTWYRHLSMQYSMHINRKRNEKKSKIIHAPPCVKVPQFVDKISPLQSPTSRRSTTFPNPVNRRVRERRPLMAGLHHGVALENHGLWDGQMIHEPQNFEKIKSVHVWEMLALLKLDSESLFPFRTNQKIKSLSLLKLTKFARAFEKRSQF